MPVVATVPLSISEKLDDLESLGDKSDSGGDESRDDESPAESSDFITGV